MAGALILQRLTTEGGFCVGSVGLFAHGPWVERASAVSKDTASTPPGTLKLP